VGVLLLSPSMFFVATDYSRATDSHRRILREQYKDRLQPTEYNDAMNEPNEGESQRQLPLPNSLCSSCRKRQRFTPIVGDGWYSKSQGRIDLGVDLCSRIDRMIKGLS
jgi:hypothetical protein